MEYNCGSSGSILLENWTSRTVTKKTKKKSIENEYNIHKICYDLSIKNNFVSLKVPKVFDISENKKSYTMERIDDANMVTNIFDIEEELISFLSLLQSQNIKAYDYELYLQENGSIYMIDFDKFSFLS